MKIKYLTIACFTLLTACGGSSNHHNSNPTNPTNCSLTYENWEKLQQTNTLTQVEAIIGCSGKKESDTQVQNGVTNSAYSWGSPANGPYILINFKNNSLTSKTFKPAEQAPSSCFPTGDQISQLKNGSTRSEVESTLGCSGSYTQSVSISDSLVTSSYTWGEATKQLLLLNFDNNILSGFSLNSSNSAESTCEAPIQGWISVIVGDNYDTTKSKLGCDGVISSITVVNNVPDIAYTWGKADTKSLALVTFKNGKVSAKSYTPKTGAISSCTPTTDKWLSLPIGSNYATIKNAIGCDGVLSSGTSVTQNSTALAFTWGNATNTLTLLNFDNDQLSGKSYTNSAQSSSSTPTQQQADQIQIGQSISTANTIVGCAGILNSMNQVTANSITKSYVWGKIASTNGLVINSDNNDVIEAKTFIPK